MVVIDTSNDCSSEHNNGTIFLSWVLISKNEIKSIYQYSKLISIEHTGMDDDYQNKN